MSALKNAQAQFKSLVMGHLHSQAHQLPRQPGWYCLGMNVGGGQITTSAITTGVSIHQTTLMRCSILPSFLWTNAYLITMPEETRITYQMYDQMWFDFSNGLVTEQEWRKFFNKLDQMMNDNECEMARSDPNQQRHKYDVWTQTRNGQLHRKITDVVVEFEATHLHHAIKSGIYYLESDNPLSDDDLHICLRDRARPGAATNFT